MKKLFFFICALVSMTAAAQIGIGVEAANIDASAQLEVASTTKGFLPPRLTASERDAINTPAAGLVVWCTNCGAKGELQVYNGTVWTNSTGGAASTVPVPVPVAIGDTYGGGIVFYILQSGDPGYDAAKQHGLISSISDQGWVTWANTSVTTGATGDGIGAGKLNTQKIIASIGGGSSAAKLCADYSDGTYTDWYLPSNSELVLLKLQMDTIGGFSYPPNPMDDPGEPLIYKLYWSSTEASASDANILNNYSIYTQGKAAINEVRAIRSF